MVVCARKTVRQAIIIWAVVGKYNMLINLENEVHGQELGHQECPSRKEGV